MGLPGDRIQVAAMGEQKEVLVPRGHVWLEGDNKAASHDSRHYGPVPAAWTKQNLKRCLGCSD